MFLTLIAAGLLLAACGSPEMIPPPQPSAVMLSSTPVRATQVAPGLSATPAVKTAAPTVKPSQPPAVPTVKPPTNAAGIVLTNGSLTVRIDSPADGATIKTSPVEIKGQAPAGTVVTINDIVLVVKADKLISVKINLEAGPNLVELIASNSVGNQVNYELVLYFEP